MDHSGIKRAIEFIPDRGVIPTLELAPPAEELSPPSTKKKGGQKWSPERRARFLTDRDAKKAPLFAWAGMTKVWEPGEAEARKQAFVEASEARPAIVEAERAAQQWRQGEELRQLCALRMAWWELAERDRRWPSYPQTSTYWFYLWEGAYHGAYGHLPPRRFLHSEEWVRTVVRTGTTKLPPHPDDGDLVRDWTRARSKRLAAEQTLAQLQPRLPEVDVPMTKGKRRTCSIEGCPTVISSRSWVLLCEAHLELVPFPVLVQVIHAAKIGQTAETALPAWHAAVADAVEAARWGAV